MQIIEWFQFMHILFSATHMNEFIILTSLRALCVTSDTFCNIFIQFDVISY